MIFNNYSCLKILFIFFLLIACSRTETSEPPETVSEVLNEFVRSAPHQFINLTESVLYDVQIPDEDVIYSVYLDVEKTSEFIARIEQFVYVNGKFIVYDSRNSGTYTLSRNGEVSGPYTRSGRGPEEHLASSELGSNSSYIFIADPRNARINVYTHEMEYHHSIHSASREMGISNELLLTTNLNQTGFTSIHPDQGLIVVHSIDSTDDTLATILPKIIPPGYQPVVYNTPKYSINKHNTIAASYQPLPWLFIIDEKFKLNRTLILDYSTFEEMNIPAMDFFKPVGNQGFGGTMPLGNYTLLDSGELFISIRNEVFHLLPNSSGEYQLTGKYHFYISGEEDPVWVHTVSKDPETGTYYAGNWDYLFRFHLSEH